MKAITIRQPWASLIAAGVKTIETRPRSTSYRGRIAIHADLHPVGEPSQTVGHFLAWNDAAGFAYLADKTIADFGERVAAAIPLPLGAVVASAVLTDCVPIEDLDGDMFECPTLDHAKILYVRSSDDEYALVVDRHAVEPPPDRYVEDQLPYGDFSPGRWALLLDDIKPTTARCPYCWGHGFVDGLFECAACATHGTCSGPVPARGQQAVPWEWTP